jgi:hypothetical protein
MPLSCGPMKQRYSPLWLAVCCLAAGAYGSSSTASELTLSREAVQAIVVATIFNDQGKWYMAKGVCYAYLERPRVSLAGGRLVIDGHLSSRVGLDVGNSCVGTDFVSDVRISGRFVGAGSQITLNDIRIDNVKDDSTRQALDLIQSAAGSSLPRAVDIDLLQLIKPTVVPGMPVRVAVTELHVDAVTTQPDKVTIDFEMKLAAR